ncbi:DUF1223 domain-containing protein [Ralstonia pseudosolanacearum]|uniref:DUF1223 domain-containing protein n=1 Tax=Ralstonia solanacearum TaxID=305 RepID=A0AA92IDT5_RALSL|nr:thioredoxin family protein [Ralstonia pseudosolanacearum]QCX49412.1 DUF1223 domain-containing protein [Ralstonia pseudosolanacearum]
MGFNRRLLQGLGVLTLLAQATHPAAASDCSALHSKSPPHTVAVVELYTSEGCNSCPPADRWLSRATADPQRWVPLALHVDYWNGPGWNDPFSRAAFTERQRALGDATHASTIYTPEVFVSGRELRRWADPADFSRAIKARNARPAQAEITLDATAGGTQGMALQTHARFTLRPLASGAEPTVAWIALTQNGLVSHPSGGENGGVELHHDHVVREWIGPIRLNEPTTTWQGEIALPAGARPADVGLAALIERPRDAEILQATAAPLCR